MTMNAGKLFKVFHRSVATTPSEIYVARTEAESFIKRCMIAVKTNPKHAEQLAQCLVAADYRGHYSHGFNRLEMYVKDIRSGICKGDGSPKILRETHATAHVDGNNLLGPVVGNFSMQTAIKKAKTEGIGFVVAKASNHYGIAGWYSLQAVKVGLLGLSFTNTSPLVVPTRARKPTLGTNPLTLAAPGKTGDSFVLDMATSAVALGKIEVAEVKKVQIPRGWGADAKGQETTDPSKVTKTGGLLPLGGSEAQGGYKGYGLAMMVEIFCGILSGGAYGNKIRRWKTTDRVANLGQCFIAINPDMFEPGFVDRMQDLMDTCRSLEPAEGETEVLVAGDPERKHMSLCDQAGGIPYHENFIHNLNVMAEELKVEKVKIHHQK